MEPLSYAFEGRALLFTGDTDFHLDGKKNPLKKCNREDTVESTGFTDPLLPDITKKPFLSTRSVQSDSNGNQFSPELSVSAKRSRFTNVPTTFPTCQVYGCNKDLSSSKEYHKKHKVCEVHSKTPVVVVNGIQQRFCQQCSRFHILSEFDEGKRSCRKRLAGHNERRRKPQFDTHLGSTYFAMDASKTSLIFSRNFPAGFFSLTNWTHPQNVEEKSVLRFHGVGKQYPSKNCLSDPLPHSELSMGPDSLSALSLLSAPAQYPSNPDGISTAHPLISKENHNAKLCTFLPFGESTSSSSSGVQLERLPVTQSTRVAEIPLTAFPQERGTVNLLELSLHLQRVEEQRCHGKVKVENGIFCDSTII